MNMNSDTWAVVAVMAACWAGRGVALAQEATTKPSNIRTAIIEAYLVSDEIVPKEGDLFCVEELLIVLPLQEKKPIRSLLADGGSDSNPGAVYYGEAEVLRLSEQIYPLRVRLRFEFELKFGRRKARFEKEMDIRSPSTSFMMRSKDGRELALVRWNEKSPPPPRLGPVRESEFDRLDLKAWILGLDPSHEQTHRNIIPLNEAGAASLMSRCVEGSLYSGNGYTEQTSQWFSADSRPVTRREEIVFDRSKQFGIELKAKTTAKKKNQMPAEIHVEGAAYWPGAEPLVIRGEITVKQVPEMFLIRSKDGRHALLLQVDEPKEK